MNDTAENRARDLRVIGPEHEVDDWSFWCVSPATCVKACELCSRRQSGFSPNR